MSDKVSHYILSIICIGCLVYLLSHYGIQLYRVSGDSMQPSYQSGEFLLIQKFGLPQQVSRFDVVTVRMKTLGDRTILKRVIGLPGETVQILNGTIYIDHVPLDEPSFLSSQFITDAGNVSSPVVLGENEYFLLGDNRSESIDSRFDEVGIIRGDTITGKVLFR